MKSQAALRCRRRSGDPVPASHWEEPGLAVAASRDLFGFVEFSIPADWIGAPALVVAPDHFEEGDAAGAHRTIGFSQQYSSTPFFPQRSTSAGAGRIVGCYD